MPETGRRHPLRAGRGGAGRTSARRCIPGPVLSRDLPPRAPRRPAPARLLRPRGQPDLARARGGHRRPRRRRVRGVRLRHGRGRRRAAPAPGPGRAALGRLLRDPRARPRRGRTASREVPTAGPVARRARRRRPRAAGDPGQPRPRRLRHRRARRRRARRGRARGRRQHHRHPARPAPAGARRRPHPGQRHQGARRPRRRRARPRQHRATPRWPPGCASCARAAGAGPGPMEAWLAHRGLATLDLRLARQAANAAAVVEVLRGHPAVAACGGRATPTTRRTTSPDGRCAGGTA